MRKNGVNRQLKEIVGGVCASDGFFAGALSVDTDKNTKTVSRETNKNDFGVITTAGRYPIAFCCRDGRVVGGCNRVMKRYLKGYVRAMLFYGKRTNLTVEQAENQAIELVRAFSSTAKICPDEIAIACTGAMDTKFSTKPYIEAMKTLFSSVDRLEESSTACAKAIARVGEPPAQFSYGFYIGDIACKIGGIFNDGAKGESLLCIMTTDVKITPEALQRALRTATADTFDALDLGGLSSPDDCIVVLSSGKAGNYIIDRADSEYDKFVYALTLAMQKACVDIAKRNGKALFCRVQNGTSKRSVKAMAKALVSSRAICNSLLGGEIVAQEVLSALHTTGEDYDFGKMEIIIKADGRETVLYEERTGFALSSTAKEQIRLSREIELIVRLWGGNYSASTIGRLG